MAICIRAYPTIDFITAFFFLYNSLGKRTEKKKENICYHHNTLACTKFLLAYDLEQTYNFNVGVGLVKNKQEKSKGYPLKMSCQDVKINVSK